MLDSPSPAAANTYAARQRALAERTSSRRSSARATVIGLPDRLASTVAPASAASALGGTGTHMSSQTSTWSARPGTSVAANSRSGPNGTVVPPRRDRPAALVVPGGVPAALVELPVRRQVGLRRHAEHLAALDHHRAVVDPVAVGERRPDDQQRRGGRRWPRPRSSMASSTWSSSGVLEDQVVDGVAAQAQLGKDRHRDARRRGTPCLVAAPARRWRRVGDGDRQGAGRDAGEPVGVGGGEVHGSTISIVLLACALAHRASTPTWTSDAPAMRPTPR